MRRPLLVALALAACGEPASSATAAPDAAESLPDVAAATDTVATDDAPPVPEDVSPGDTEAPDVGQPPPRFRFEPATLSGVTPWWGASAVGEWVLGGVDGIGNVQDGVYSATAVVGGFEATRVASLDVPRYCACALHDSARDELVVVGGRTTGFQETETATLVDLATGVSTPLEDAAPAAYPVGCSAWYAPSTDRGYAFGGLSGAEAAFSSTTWRWDPDARAFTALDIEGPPGRYDAAVHVLDDGDLLLASGMGLGAAVVFYDDVWRFDAQTETWSRLDAVGEAPPGRRYAWSAVSPDETLLLFGFGSDSPTGQSLLGDLWVFDLETRTWAPAEVDGAMPEARGFTPNWQVAEGEPGVLAFGANAVLQVFPDVFILRAPEGLKGRWK